MNSHYVDRLVEAKVGEVWIIESLTMRVRIKVMEIYDDPQARGYGPAATFLMKATAPLISNMSIVVHEIGNDRSVSVMANGSRVTLDKAELL